MGNRSGVWLVTLGVVSAVGGRVSAADGYHIFVVGMSRVVISHALEGAVTRLSREECRQVLDEFVDADGQSLRDVVGAAAKQPEDLFATLYFVDGDGTPQCRVNHLLLFTMPGSHVVHVCPRFAEAAARLREMLLIHELLHTLGLGENPPTSDEITRAVMKRCR